jgi:hypothetical protein
MTPEEHHRRIAKLAKLAEQSEAIARGTARLAVDVQIVALHRGNSSPLAISQRLGVTENRVLAVLGHQLK